MNEDVLMYKKYFSKGQLLVSFILWDFFLVQVIANDVNASLQMFALTTILFGINIIVDVFHVYKKVVIWYIFRIAQLIFLSIAFLNAIYKPTFVLFAVLLTMNILELMMVNDFTDLYSRLIILMVTSVPSVAYMLILLFASSKEQSRFFIMIGVFGTIIVLVSTISSIMANVITSADKRVFELSRLSEKMKRVNETLNSQQDKLKKANEELGIQKIKLETAYNRINNVNTEINLQNKILKYISSSLEIDTLLNLITESLFEALDLDICAVILQPNIAENDEAMFRIQSHLSDKALQLISNQIKHGSLNRYIKVNENYIDNHIKPGTYPFIEAREIRSLLIVPLVRGEVIQGALLCGKAQQDFFNDNILFFENVVTQLLVAIHNASLYTKMQQMAIRDSLTGIYNRGHMNLLIDQFSKTARETKTSLSVALFDIDHFKSVNDTYGHLFGDVVIKNIAGFILEVASKHHGIAARYGGEEFVMALPNCNVSECYSFVQEIKQKIDQMKLVCENDTVTVRVSVGIASYPETSIHLTQLLNRADSAMYYSKKTGRDRISIDSEEIYEYVKKTGDDSAN